MATKTLARAFRLNSCANSFGIRGTICVTYSKSFPVLKRNIYNNGTKLDKYEQATKDFAFQAEQKRKDADEEEKIKNELLTTALDYVIEFGWTKEALKAAAGQLGHPGTVAGIVKGDGAAELIIHHMKFSNRKLDEWMVNELTRLNEERTKLNIRKFIREAIITRLMMNSKYIEAGRWTEALALSTNPQNSCYMIEVLQELCDDIWHRIGDTSTDCNWYSKRISLGAVYAATEIFMLQDNSPGFGETWLFLDRRLDELTAFPSLTKVPGDVISLLRGLTTTVRNISGMQN